MGKHMGFCIVPDCLNMYYPGSTRLHRLPKNEKKKARWLKCLKLTENDLYDGAKVCHLHFTFTDYSKNDPKTNRLKNNALPSINEDRRYSDHGSDAESIDINKILENLSKSSSPTNTDDESDLISDVSAEEFLLNMTSSDDEEVKKRILERQKKLKKVTSKRKVAKKKTIIGKRVTILCSEEKQHDFAEESDTFKHDDNDDVDEVEKVEKQESEPEIVEQDGNENMLTQVCRTCLATECKMYSIKQCDFERAYVVLTGICLDTSVTAKMPQMLCFECVQRFRNFMEFSAKSITAAHLLMEFIREDKLTMANIKSIDRKKISLTSKLVTSRFKPNHFNIRLEEHEYENNGINEAPCDMDVNILEEDNKHGILDTEASDNQDNNATDEPMGVDLDDHSNIKVEIDLGQGAENDRELDKDSDRWDEEDDNLAPIEQVTEQVSRDTGGDQHGRQVPNEIMYCSRGRSGKTMKIMKKEFNDMFIAKTLKPLEQREEINNRKNGREYINGFFKCDKCYRGFQTKNSFNDHMKKHDIESGEFVCDICLVHFRTRQIVFNHIRTSHWTSYSCRRCDFVTSFHTAALTHKNVHEGFRFQCNLCPKNYSKLAPYLDHTRRFHPEDVVCHLCGLSFALVRDLDRHLRLTHKKENLHLLPATESSPYGEMRRTKTTKYVAVRYVTTLPEDAPHCPKCDIRFRDEEALRAHLSHSLSHGNSVYQVKKQIRRRPKLEIEANQPKTRKQTQGTVICEQCGEDFVNFRSYGSHFAFQHPYEIRTQYPAHRRNRKGMHMCDVCGKIYQRAHTLRDHRESHNGVMHPCDKCDKKFTTKMRLTMHKMNHTHSRRCNVCKKKFRCLTNLNRHMRIHTHKPYACGPCNKRFSTPSEKQSHIRHAHMGVPWPKKRPKGDPKLRQRRCSSSSSS